MPEPMSITSPDCAGLKRLASQISLQLPTNHADALEVLGYLRDLIDWEAGLVRPSRVVTDEGSTVLTFARPA